MAHLIAATEIILLVTISGSCFWLIFLAIVYRKHWMPGKESKSLLYPRNIHLIGKIIELLLAAAQLCYHSTRANILWYCFTQAFITTNICNETCLVFFVVGVEMKNPPGVHALTGASLVVLITSLTPLLGSEGLDRVSMLWAPLVLINVAMILFLLKLARDCSDIWERRASGHAASIFRTVVGIILGYSVLGTTQRAGTDPTLLLSISSACLTWVPGFLTVTEICFVWRQLALTPMVPRRSLEFIASSAVVAVKNLGANESTELVVSDPENGSIACQPQLESFHQSTEEVTTATSVKEMTGP